MPVMTFLKYSFTSKSTYSRKFHIITKFHIFLPSAVGNAREKTK